MKLLMVLVVVVAVGCAEDNPARHLDGGNEVDSIGNVDLVVTKAGNGSGTVSSAPAGISCGESCTASFLEGSVVTLTAAPADDSDFAGWTGGCTGAATTCDVTLAAAANVTATFKLKTHTVTLAKAGPGSGAIHGDSVDCTANCTLTVDHGTTLTFTGVPTGLSVFAGWGGACSGTGECTVTVTSDVTIDGNFALDNFTLFAATTGTGTGTVTSTPAGISCGATCSHTFTANQVVTLTATPATGSSFTSWSGGGCSGAGPCTVTIDGAKTVTATFTLNKYAVDVTPTGMGAVTSSPTGIDCGATCSHSYDYNTMVTLTAVPATGWSFTGWGGACSGSATTCTLTVNAAKNVTATFTIKSYLLTVTNGGNGTVAGGGINCGATCTGTFTHGTNVTLTATPNTGYHFVGWGGACTGTGNCAVTMDAAKTVTATFAINTYTLTVTNGGNGTITGGGINCGTQCSGTYNYTTTPFTLTATPATGYHFVGWTGACTGTGTCSVTMNGDKTVGATFAINTYTLTVTNGGNGNVTGGGINCGTQCTGTYNYTTTPFTLTAMPAMGYHFVGWTGACTGTGTCSVTMNADRTVGATFAINTYTLTVTNGGNGTITGGGINCGATCSGTYNYTTTPFTLTATPATGYHFVGWTGACTGTGTCSVTMNADRSVGATFAINTYTLAVTKQGSGTGTVTGPSINCGATCSGTYNYTTTPITLTASADPGSVFTGWSGDCSGTGTCSITMNQAHNVTATFTKTAVLTMTTTGVNGATGTLSDGTVMCSGSCTHTVPVGTTLTITQTPSATPATASDFVGWSVASCSGNSCVVTVNANMTVTATYKLKPNIMFLTSQTYDGNLNGIDGADKACQTLADQRNLGGTYKAYLSYQNQYLGGITPIITTVNAPNRFIGASGWVRVDGKPLANTIDQMHLGTLFSSPSVLEDGTTVSPNESAAWTGTSSNGTVTSYCYQDSYPYLTGWAGYGGTGEFGDATRTDSFVVQQDNLNCANKLHLYCFGVDRAAVAQ